MRIEVNGAPMETDASSITDLLAGLDRHHGPCAVELNGTLVPWRSHSETDLHDGDQVEIVTLVGGG